MRRARSGKSWITSIVQIVILKLRLTSAYPSTLIASRQPQHPRQQLYHALSQLPIHHHEGLEEDSRSTQVEEEEEMAASADLKSESSAVGGGRRGYVEQGKVTRNQI